MTRDEMVAQVQELLGFRTDQASVIAARIQVEQTKLETEVQWAIYPWFLQSDRTTTSCVAEEERLAKPDDWIADMEEDGLWVVNEDGYDTLLVKSEENKLRNTFRESDPGIPQYYSSSGDYYRLFPTPDIAYTMKMRYYQADAVLSTVSSTNRWSTRAPNCLIGRTGLLLAGAQDNARRDMFAAIWQEAKTAIERKSFDELTVNRQYAMGENQ